MAKFVVVLIVELSYVQWSTLGYYCMHMLNLLHSRYLLNNLQLFRNVKVSVRTSQDIAPTLLIQLNFPEPLLTLLLGFLCHKLKLSKFKTYFSHSIWRNELLMWNFEFVTRLYGCFMLRVTLKMRGRYVRKWWC